MASGFSRTFWIRDQEEDGMRRILVAVIVLVPPVVALVHGDDRTFARYEVVGCQRGSRFTIAHAAHAMPTTSSIWHTARTRAGFF